MFSELVQVPVGNTCYQYDWTYFLCLLIGWLTIALYARKNFDQPTYEVTEEEPASIMVPALISSNAQYLRGLLIYFSSITLLYLAVSLSGPTVVIPIIDALSGNNTKAAAATPADQAKRVTCRVERRQKDEPPQYSLETPNSQWPIGVALAIIGLMPSIAGLRLPEIILRRFAHRIAAIPAYTKYVAAQMRKSKFNYKRFTTFNYAAAGINFRPPPESPDSFDRNWRKLCILYVQVRKFALGDDAPESSQPVDEKTLRAIEREIKTFGSLLHDLDTRLLGQHTDQEREDLQAEIVDLSRWLYMLASCMFVAYRTDDIPQALWNLGFVPFEPAADLVAPILVTFGILFIILLLQQMGAIALTRAHGGDETQGLTIATLISDSFWLWCYSAAIVVISCGSAVYAAIVLREQLIRRNINPAIGKPANVGANLGDLYPYLKILLGAYLVAFATQFVLNMAIRIPQMLNTSVAMQGQSPAGLFSTVLQDAAISALAPTGGAVMACIWLTRKNVQGIGIVRDVMLTAIVMAVLAGVSTFLRFNGPYSSMPLEQLQGPIFFYGLLYLFVGITVGVFAAMLRSYREKFASA